MSNYKIFSYKKARTIEIEGTCPKFREYYNNLLLVEEHPNNYLKERKFPYIGIPAGTLDPYQRFFTFFHLNTPVMAPFRVAGIIFDNSIAGEIDTSEIDNPLFTVTLKDYRVLVSLMKLALEYDKAFLALQINLKAPDGSQAQTLVKDFISYNHKRLKLEQLRHDPDESGLYSFYLFFKAINMANTINPDLDEKIQPFFHLLNKTLIEDPNFQTRSWLGKAWSVAKKICGHTIIKCSQTAILGCSTVQLAAMSILSGIGFALTVMLCPTFWSYDEYILKPLLERQTKALQIKIRNNPFYEKYQDFAASLPPSTKMVEFTTHEEMERIGQEMRQARRKFVEKEQGQAVQPEQQVG